ncbi:hypothetical protein GCM10009754_57800 [Amycolatopsis minnesotensis]|uniref:Uncharacterized protein n=1 Tax=Amycolatopsis minnesotensis TaxID=337894 RepID=A0ABN2RUF7_9PSEU
MVSGGFSAPSGVTIPQSAMRGPPAGCSGTGSGRGAAWPGAGFSEVSTGGGGVSLFAHAAGGAGTFGVGFEAAAGPVVKASKPDNRARTRTGSDRREALCTRAG